MLVQSHHTRLEILLLVVNGDHYVQDRRTGGPGREVLPALVGRREKSRFACERLSSHALLHPCGGAVLCL